jgi:Tfp pilus assembly protein PilN
MRFNYLGESVPSLVDRLLAIRIPERLRSPFLGVATAVFVVAAWWALEQHALAVATAEERAAQVRLDQSRSAVAVARIQRTGIDRMLSLDRRLRDVRLSGSSVGVHLADIANHVPAHAWLTSLSQERGAIEIVGQVAGMERLSATLAALTTMKSLTDPLLVRATKEDRPGAAPLVGFEVRVDE